MIKRTLSWLAFAFLASVLSTAVAANSDMTWKQIDAKAANAAGPAVDIQSNYWLAWTGAWDTVVMKERKIAEKWLPKGSTVEWKRNLQGPPVITDLVANKQQIGYIGDNPAIVSTTKRALAPIDLVAVNEMSPGRMCGIVIVRSDAPQFRNREEVMKWLNGKTVGVPKGSCADRLGQLMFKKEGIHVTWQQMQAEVVVTSLQAKRIDAAVLYEPHVSKAVFSGYARYAVSPAVYGEEDADAVVMRQDFINAHREAAVAWLKANIEALYFIRDNPVETVNLVKKELPDYTRENLWYAIYGAPPQGTGASSEALYAEMALTKRARALLERGYHFLHDIKIVTQPDFAPGAVRADLVDEAFKELGLDPAQGLYQLKASSNNPFKGDELIAKTAAR